MSEEGQPQLERFRLNAEGLFKMNADGEYKKIRNGDVTFDGNHELLLDGALIGDYSDQFVDYFDAYLPVKGEFIINDRNFKVTGKTVDDFIETLTGKKVGIPVREPEPAVQPKESESDSQLRHFLLNKDGAFERDDSGNYIEIEYGLACDLESSNESSKLLVGGSRLDDEEPLSDWFEFLPTGDVVINDHKIQIATDAQIAVLKEIFISAKEAEAPVQKPEPAVQPKKTEPVAQVKEPEPVAQVKEPTLETKKSSYDYRDAATPAESTGNLLGEGTFGRAYLVKVQRLQDSTKRLAGFKKERVAKTVGIEYFNILNKLAISSKELLISEYEKLIESFSRNLSLKKDDFRAEFNKFKERIRGFAKADLKGRDNELQSVERKIGDGFHDVINNTWDIIGEIRTRELWSKVASSRSIHRQTARKLVTAPKHPVITTTEAGDFRLSVFSEVRAGDFDEYDGKKDPVTLFKGKKEEDKAQQLLNMLVVLKGLHDNQYAHRDIKPGNIFATTDGEASLGDFGATSHISMVADFAGTDTYIPEYTISELSSGLPTKEVLLKTDVFALARSFADILVAKKVTVEDDMIINQLEGVRSRNPTIFPEAGNGPGQIPEKLHAVLKYMNDEYGFQNVDEIIVALLVLFPTLESQIGDLGLKVNASILEDLKKQSAEITDPIQIVDQVKARLAGEQQEVVESFGINKQSVSVPSEAKIVGEPKPQQGAGAVGKVSPLQPTSIVSPIAPISQEVIVAKKGQEDLLKETVDYSNTAFKDTLQTLHPSSKIYFLTDKSSKFGDIPNCRGFSVRKLENGEFTVKYLDEQSFKHKKTYGSIDNLLEEIQEGLADGVGLTDESIISSNVNIGAHLMETDSTVFKDLEEKLEKKLFSEKIADAGIIRTVDFISFNNQQVGANLLLSGNFRKKLTELPEPEPDGVTTNGTIYFKDENAGIVISVSKTETPGIFAVESYNENYKNNDGIYLKKYSITGLSRVLDAALNKDVKADEDKRTLDSLIPIDVEEYGNIIKAKREVANKLKQQEVNDNPNELLTANLAKVDGEFAEQQSVLQARSLLG
jgi:hypothetical protein